jgi:hypothetical protein
MRPGREIESSMSASYGDDNRHRHKERVEVTEVREQVLIVHEVMSFLK